MKEPPESLARELVAAARLMAAELASSTRGVGPRSAVFLLRQALEIALTTFWTVRARGVESCSGRAQLLCLGAYTGDEEMARLAHHTWSALSRATHHHPYELTPTHEELLAFFDAVESVIEVIEAKSSPSRLRAGSS